MGFRRFSLPREGRVRTAKAQHKRLTRWTKRAISSWEIMQPIAWTAGTMGAFRGGTFTGKSRRYTILFHERAGHDTRATAQRTGVSRFAQKQTKGHRGLGLTDDLKCHPFNEAMISSRS